MMAVPIMSAPGEAADGKSSQLATLKRLVVAVERMALSIAGVLFLLLVLFVFFVLCLFCLPLLLVLPYKRFHW